MSKRKIKIFTLNNFPYGGASANFVRNFAASLALDENAEVEVIVPRGNFFTNKQDVSEQRKGVEGKVKYRHLAYLNHPVNPIGGTIDNVLSVVLPFFYLFGSSLKKDRDVVVVYNTSVSWTMSFIFFKWLSGVKLITILPEFYKKPTVGFSSSWIRWYDFYLGVKYLVKHSDQLITLTTYMKKFVTNCGFDENKAMILPNITDINAFRTGNVKTFYKEKITIGYCGTPNFKDGIDDLLTGFGKLTAIRKDVHLLIIGDSTFGKSLIPGLQNKVDKAGLTGKVTFTGLVPFQEVTGLLHSCQILTLTRPAGVFAEAGFPTKLGEYFACMKPVLATEVGDIGYYFENNKHMIIVEPGNTDAIAAGFNTLAEQQELGNELVRNAYQWMEEHLSHTSLSVKLSSFCCSRK